MPTLNTKTIEPIPGSLSRAIKSGVAKGKTFAQIRKTLPLHLKGKSVGIQSDLFNYWQQTKKGATVYKLSGESRPLSEIVKANRVANPQLLRVTIGFDFYNPDIEEEQSVGFDVDLPVGLSKQELYKTIVGKIFDWLVKYYSFSVASKFFKGEYSQLVQIKAIEGI